MESKGMLIMVVSIIIVVLIWISIIGFVLLNGDNGTFGGDEKNVEYEVVIVNNQAQLDITLEGMEKNCNVSLYNPNGKEVGSIYVTSNETDDNHQLTMTKNKRENPPGGQYYLAVKHPITDDIYYETEPVFEKGDINITNVELKYNHVEDEFWTVKQMKLNITNDGDLPIFLDSVQTSETRDIDIDKGIVSGNTVQIKEWFSIGGGIVRDGDSITISVHSNQQVMDSCDTTVDIPN